MSTKEKDKQPAGKNALEWTVFGLSAILVLGVMIVLALDALDWKGGPARLEAKLGSPLQENGTLVVPVEITNHGDIAAVDVQVEVEGGEGTKPASLTLDFVPRGATRGGHVVFPASQNSGDLQVRIMGYQEP